MCIFCEFSKIQFSFLSYSNIEISKRSLEFNAHNFVAYGREQLSKVAKIKKKKKKKKTKKANASLCLCIIMHNCTCIIGEQLQLASHRKASTIRIKSRS